MAAYTTVVHCYKLPPVYYFHLKAAYNADLRHMDASTQRRMFQAAKVCMFAPAQVVYMLPDDESHHFVPTNVVPQHMRPKGSMQLYALVPCGSEHTEAGVNAALLEGLSLSVRPKRTSAKAMQVAKRSSDHGLNKIKEAAAKVHAYRYLEA